MVVSIWPMRTMSDPAAPQAKRLSVAVMATSTRSSARSACCACEEGTVVVTTSRPALAKQPMRSAMRDTAGTTKTDCLTVTMGSSLPVSTIEM